MNTSIELHPRGIGSITLVDPPKIVDRSSVTRLLPKVCKAILEDAAPFVRKISTEITFVPLIPHEDQTVVAGAAWHIEMHGGGVGSGIRRITIGTDVLQDMMRHAPSGQEYLQLPHIVGHEIQEQKQYPFLIQDKRSGEEHARQETAINNEVARRIGWVVGKPLIFDQTTTVLREK